MSTLKERLIGATYRKSSGSGDVGCVEVAHVPGAVGVRDTKDRRIGPLAFRPAAWQGFVSAVVRNRLK